MRKGFRRSLYRVYVHGLNRIYKSSVSYILLVAIVGTITFKFKRVIFNLVPSNGPVIYDNYQPKPPALIHEYNNSLEGD